MCCNTRYWDGIELQPSSDRMSLQYGKKIWCYKMVVGVEDERNNESTTR